MSDEQWGAAHERLRGSRQNYLRHTNGRVWGRPANGVESKFLLTGMAICGACGAGMLIRSRKANRQRAFFYGCAANHQRGEAICANGLEIPMAIADSAVLEIVEQSILTPAVIEEAIDRLFSMVNEPSDEADRRAANLQGEIDRLEAEVARLTEAIAEGGALSPIVDALKKREGRLQELRASLGAVHGMPNPRRA
ncbi:MAG: zinc ribbon domain-containing protein [Vicinamibacterales bacterium]